MSEEGGTPKASYELWMGNNDTKKISKISGSVGIRELSDGTWEVEAFDDEGVRLLPMKWESIELADAFARGFVEGLDQGLINAIRVLEKAGAINRGVVEIMPQQVREHDGDDD